MSNARPYSWALYPGGATGKPAFPARKRLYNLRCSEFVRTVLVMRGTSPARPAASTRSFAGPWSSSTRSEILPISFELAIFQGTFAPEKGTSHIYVGLIVDHANCVTWQHRELLLLKNDHIPHRTSCRDDAA